jgi:predicted ATP-dependent endonuclease of OLD family
MFYSEGVISEVKINTRGAEWFKWNIFIKTPYWPRDIDYISAWSAIILYFVVLKNWLNLEKKSYTQPNIMIFDELDSAIHPSLIWKFSELLKIISHKVQLFITSHSTTFIDNFERENIYLLKDIWSFNEKVKVKSNVMSYEKIMSSLNEEEQEVFKKMSNSELYINWYIDTFFPIIK